MSDIDIEGSSNATSGRDLVVVVIHLHLNIGSVQQLVMTNAPAPEPKKAEPPK